MKHFLIIDKQPVVIAGISSFLSVGFPSFKITFILPEEVLTHISDEKYDACIIGMIWNDLDQVIKHILKQFNDTKIFLFSDDINAIYVKHYLKLGVKGIVSKNANSETFLEGILTVLQNQFFLCDDIKNILTTDFEERKNIGKKETLSKREIEVADMLVSGMTNNSISTKLKLHSSSIGTYKTRIFEKLNVKNIIELKHYLKTNNLK